MRVNKVASVLEVVEHQLDLVLVEGWIELVETLLEGCQVQRILVHSESESMDEIISRDVVGYADLSYESKRVLIWG